MNGHADLGRALAGLGADLAAVVERDGRHFPHGAAAWGRQEGGRIVDWRILEDEDDVLELEPAYVVRAPLRALEGPPDTDGPTRSRRRSPGG